MAGSDTSIARADRDTPASPAPGFTTTFFAWGIGAYAVVLGGLLVLCLRRSQGTLVYVIDDPAIHLTVAENLARHGTWGVVPGQFQSASSSPLWTVVLAVWVRVLPFASTWGPLVINVAASVWVIAVFAKNQRLLLPGPRRVADVLATAAIVTVVLFLPGLSMLGMEHVLHTALVLSAVVMLARRANGVADRWPGWLPYVLLALGTLVRFETLFVAAGLGVAHLARSLRGATEGGSAPFLPQLRRATIVGTVAAVPFAAFAWFNHAMGQGWLPNSVLAKGQTINGAGNTFTFVRIVARLAGDPLLFVMVCAAFAVVALTWGRGLRSTFGAITFAVAAMLHATFAQIGWFERYQAYLVALGALVLLQVAEELLPAERRAPAPRARLVPVLVAVALLGCGIKVDLTNQAPSAVSDTYQQRYQAGRFFGRYYAGASIATSELGYIALQHDGPITDLYGLGDYEVLEARRAHDQRPGRGYWEELTTQRGFRVAGMYPTTLFETTPETWVLVGEWHLDRQVITAWEPTFQFYATDPDEVAPLEQHLVDFEKDLPPGVRQTLNPLAGFRADAIKAERAGG